MDDLRKKPKVSFTIINGKPGHFHVDHQNGCRTNHRITKNWIFFTLEEEMERLRDKFAKNPLR